MAIGWQSDGDRRVIRGTFSCCALAALATFLISRRVAAAPISAAARHASSSLHEAKLMSFSISCARSSSGHARRNPSGTP